MKFLSQFSVLRPVSILMMVLISILIGTLSLSNLSTELFPSINMPFAIVSTQFPNATPEEVEMMLTKPIEGSLSTVSNVKNITSVSSENSSRVMIEFIDGTNMDTAMVEMRENLGMIQSYLPSGATTPMIMKMNPSMMPIMSFAVGVEGLNKIESTLFVQNELLPLIERIPGVGQASLSGTSKNEVSIILDPLKIETVVNRVNATIKKNFINQLIENGMPTEMAEKTPLPSNSITNFHLTTEMISGILQSQNFSMPAGYITTDGIQYLVRIGDKLNSIEELTALPIIKNDIMTITLEDVALIEMVDTSDSAYTKVNGQDAIMISIQKQSEFATTDVVNAISKEIKKIETDYNQVNINILMNQGDYINLAVNTVTSNLFLGGLLAVIILFIFLRAFGPTLIIGLSIPISVMVTFILIYFSGITLNMISMGGLALGVGMLVDNSIVVIENIYRLRSLGVSKRDAAITGASQVASAITASTLTTIAVFLPVLFVNGMTADIFREMALTVSFSLIGSLVVALTLVPMLASKILKQPSQPKQTSLMISANKGYKKALIFALNHKLLIILTPIILLFVSFYLGRLNGLEFFPETDQGQITVSVSLPSGATDVETESYLDEIISSFMSVEEIKTVGATVGKSMMSSKEATASLYILLNDDRKLTTDEVSQKLRHLSKDFEHEIRITNQNSTMMSFSSGISINVKGSDFKILEQIATDVATLISSTEGTTEVNTGINKSSEELKITVDREKSIEHGFSNAQIFAAVKDYISPKIEKSKLTLSGYDFPINIQNSESEKNYSLEALENLKLQTPSGQVILLKDVASVTYETGYNTINRDNQSRLLTVTAKLQNGYNIGKVGAQIEQKLKDYATPEGYQIVIGGEQEQINDAISQLIFALLAAILLVYMVMAAQFESLKFPFIILMTVPLAITGGFLALFITQTPISVVSMIGFIILTGVVVNNGIVIIDYINQQKDTGLSTTDAILQAGQDRLRPIILTALTTITALIPMALGIGDGSETMAPMAITTIGGLLYATLLTLFIVPTLYSVVERKHTKN